MNTERQIVAASDSQLEIRSGAVRLESVSALMEWCVIIANSNLTGRDLKSPEAIFLAVQMGTEIGLTPTQALQSIAVINGKPSLYGDAALALVTSHKDCVDIIESFEGGDDGMTAICEVHRRDRSPVKRKFSVAMAKKAGLWGKSGPWSQYGPRMLQMRARSWALRDSFPDALKGISIKEEAQDYGSEPKLAKVARETTLSFGDPEPDPGPESVAPTTEEVTLL